MRPLSTQHPHPNTPLEQYKQNLPTQTPTPKMKTLEQLTQLTTSLQYNIDCLMIRMQSCQQYIERLLRIVGDCSMNLCERYSSLDQIRSVERIGEDGQARGRRVKKSMPEVVQGQLNIRSNSNNKTQANTRANTHQTYPTIQQSPPPKPSPPKLPSLHNLILFSSTKQQKNKNVESGSLTLMKNAILVNIHEIEQLEESVDRLRQESEERYGKCDRAVQLVTRVVGMVEEKLEELMREGMRRADKSARKDRKEREKQKEREKEKGRSRAQYLTNYLSV